jgi:chromosome segregation ATPase
MSFTVNDLQDLTRLLATHPEWLSEVRRLVLTKELLSLPDIVRELAEAQRRTEERLEQLAEAQRRTEERLEQLAIRLDQLAIRVDQLTARVEQLAEAQRRTEERLEQLSIRVEQLAEAQRRTEERLEQLTARVDQLAEAQRRTEERLEQLAARVDQLAEAQRRTEERLDDLAKTVQRLVNQMAEVRGDVLEIKFRDKAPSFFGRWLRRVQVVPIIEIEERLEAALTDKEVSELLALDLLVRGRPREANAKVDELWLAVEVSSVIDAGDVQRAERRAALLRQAGLKAVPVTAGARINAKAQKLADSLRVAVMKDGTDQGWERAYSAAVS